MNALKIIFGCHAFAAFASGVVLCILWKRWKLGRRRSATSMEFGNARDAGTEDVEDVETDGTRSSPLLTIPTVGVDNKALLPRHPASTGILRRLNEDKLVK
ncbi:MAG: hypothetical protein Q9171_004440 [Xanthocarpia ochracea]